MSAGVAVVGARPRRTVVVASWGFADQALVSASNFATMIVVARALGPVGFGRFTLAYAVLLFMVGVQSALFTQPHNVLGAARAGAAYRRYTTATAAAQAAFAAAAALVLAAAAAAAALAGSRLWTVLLPLAGALLAWQLQEFARRVLYTRGRSHLAFANDLANYGLQTVVLVGLWRLDALTPARALLAIAATSTLASAWAAALLRHDVSRGPLELEAVRENWRFGRWLIGTTVLYSLWSQAFAVLAAAFVGVAATGGLRAVQSVMGSTRVIAIAFEAVALPAAAAAWSRGGSEGTRRFVNRFTLVALAPLLLVCVAAAGAGPTLLTALFGPGYARYAPLLWIVGAAYVVMFVGDSLSLRLRAARRGRALFYGQLAAAAAALALAPLLAWRWGLWGIAVGTLVAPVVFAVSLASQLRESREEAP